MKKIALIYARVSSLRQAQEGNGLDGQELRCKSFAIASGYSVGEVFKDSFTGGDDFMKRPAMAELLEYIDKNPYKEFVVVFDDISRLARDVVQHVKLRTTFNDRGVEVKCPNFKFEDSPEGEMIELIMAAQSQYHRKSNKRQVNQKMRARMESGYWTFNSKDIAGYKRNDTEARDWILVKSEPDATLIKEAFEGYSSGRFQNQKDVQEYLKINNFKGGKKIHLSQVERILSRVLYAGYIEYPAWEVTRRKGHHEAIVSLATFEEVQEKLRGKAGFRARKDTREDFPIRGLAACESCSQLLTASFSTASNGVRHPYYRCATKKCVMKNKSIRKVEIEDCFAELLKEVTPTKEAISLTKALFMKRWDKKLSEHSGSSEIDEKRLSVVQKQVESLSLRAATTRNEKLAQVYEKQIEKLSNEELLLSEKILKQDVTSNDFGTALDEVFGVLKNPYDYWISGDLNDKKLASKLVFADRINYSRENGFGTPELSLPVKVFELVGTNESLDVDIDKNLLNSLKSFIYQWHQYFNAVENSNLGLNIAVIT